MSGFGSKYFHGQGKQLAATFGSSMRELGGLATQVPGMVNAVKEENAIKAKIREDKEFRERYYHSKGM